ncbi:hypothetical protein ACERJO_08775 [Halalkalibacter sp. AB-rgal2]|uniref:hypothetical protein n=1 Tax=Halalkalibacter sp. AB-rgal2 TaxID=3242695 RepID=UPI00359E3AE6
MINSQKLKVIGNDRIKGKQEISEINISGTATFQKEVKTEFFEVIGRCKLNATVQSETFINKGSCFVKDKLTCNKLINIGQGSFHNIDADSIKSFGSLKVNDSILCRTFQSTGYIKLDGELIGEHVSMEVSAPSKVHEIKGNEKVAIKSVKATFFNIISFVRRKVIANSIQGKNVYLEHTEANHVSGENVDIGKKCKIEEVFYKQRLKIHSSALVRKSTRI